MFSIEWTPFLTRRRYKAMERFDTGLDRPRLGETQERQARSTLRPRSGAVEAVAALDRDIRLDQELDAAMRRRP